jgi:membrane-associated phospholipid phosphatase
VILPEASPRAGQGPPPPDRPPVELDLCDARPGRWAERIARRVDGLPAAVAAIVVAVTGCIVLAACMIGIGELLVHLLPGSLKKWDNDAVRWFAARRTPTRTDLSLRITWFAEATTVTATGLALVVIMAIKRMWRLVGLVVFSLVVEVGAYEAVTAVVKRHRPPVHWLEHLRPYASFPSGHTAAALALYCSIAIMVATLTHNRAWRVAAWTLAAIMPPMVAVARLYRGMHHPTDVVAGYLMGIACVAVALLAVRVGGVVADRRAATDPRIGAA